MCPEEEPLPPTALVGEAPTPEDVIVLQSTVSALREERDHLLRRLQSTEASARERVQLAEARTREAQAQVDALKRATQQIRQQFEEALLAERDAAGTLRSQIQEWEHRSADLTRLLDTAQCRIADLETENAVFAAEVERLAQERLNLQQQLEQLQGQLDSLEQEQVSNRNELETLRRAFEETCAEKERLAHDLDEALRHWLEEQRVKSDLSTRLEEAQARIVELEHLYRESISKVQESQNSLARERDQWQEERSHLQELWQQERYELARCLEESENRALALEQELDRTRASLCSVQLREQATADEIARLDSELESARQEHLRERELFEQVARERQEEFAAAERAWQTLLEQNEREAQRQVAELEEALRGLRKELREAEESWRAAQARGAELAQTLQAREAALVASQEELRSLAAQLASAEEEKQKRQEQSEHWRAAAAQAQRRAEEADTQLRNTRSALATARAEHAQSILEGILERQRRADELFDLVRERDAEQQRAEELERIVAERDRLLAHRTVSLHGTQLECARLAAIQAAVQQRLDQTFSLLMQERQAHRDEIDWREREREALASRVFEQTRTLGSLRVALAAAEATVDSLQRERATLLQTLAGQAGVQHELEDRLRMAEAELVRTREANEVEKRQVTVRVQELEAGLQDAQARLAEAEATVATLRSERASIAEQLDASRKSLELLQQDYDRLSHSTGEATAEWQRRVLQAEEQLEVARQEIASLSSQIAAHEAKASEMEDRLAVRAQEEERLAAELAKVQAMWAAEQEARLAAEARAADAQRQWEALQEQSVSILQAQEVLAHENDSLRQGQEELRAQMEALLGERDQADQERAEARQRAEQLQALLLRQQQEFAAVHQRLDAERDALRTALDAARAQQAQLTAQVTQLQQELAEVSHPASPPPSFDLIEFERERAELRAQVEKLSAVIRQLGQEREEQRLLALQTQASLNARIEELSAERGTLALRVAELETLSSQLERECERLQRERLTPDELRKHKAEIARLEARVEELERLRNEAAQNHSAVVANYLLELNQRAEMLQEREAELQRLQAELTAAQQVLEELQLKLDQEREERATLASQLDELRRSVGPGRLGGTVPAKSRPAAGSEASSTSSTPLRLEGPQTKSNAKLSTPALDLDGLTLVHIEESKDYREQVQRLVQSIPNGHYLNTTEAKQLDKAKSLVLVVNLLNRAHDPIAAIGHVASSGDPSRHVFAYCADGKFGFLFGEASFFPSPLEPRACSAWLMSRIGSAQKLLVASNDIEMTSRLRTELNRIRCSASVALDMRQVLDLIPLIQPEVVLVDLSLPRAEGLRLVSRLRSDEKTSRLPLGVLLPAPQKLAEFRQNAQRAAREGTLTPDALLSALAAQLNVELPRESQHLGAGKRDEPRVGSR